LTGSCRYGVAVTPAIILALLIAQPAPDSGYLTVRSNLPGLAVYLEGDYLGRAPVTMHRLKPGRYSVGIVSDDSLENIYWHLRQGRVGERLSSIWTLAAINAGTQSVEVKPGLVTEVMIDHGRILSAPGEAKAYGCCAVGGLFLFGAVVGFLVHWLAYCI
jgi:hypothetical protein